MSYQNVVRDILSLNKGILIRGNEVIHKGLKSINKDFLNDLVYHITKINRPKVCNIIREGSFGYNSDVSMIKGFEERTCVEKGMHSVEDILFDNALIFLEEESRDTSKS